MHRHAEQRVLPYTAEQLFELVISVDRYPEFLPWCRACRIFDRAEDRFNADMVIGFKLLREQFGSRVTFEHPRWIDVTPTKGPFKHMENHWAFEDLDAGRCRIDFKVDFKFRSRVLDKLMGALFHEAVRKMVNAFEGRAREIYGVREKA